MKLLVIDGHQLFAEAIRTALEGSGVRVVGLASSGHEGLDQVRRKRPDIVLIDLALTDPSGLDIGGIVLREFEGTRVVALTARDDAGAVAEAMRRGFHGHLSKDIPLARFVSALTSAPEGEVIKAKAIPGTAGTRRLPERRAAKLLGDQLTPREREVLAYLVEGLDGRGIAKQLSISSNTVRTHVQSILTKLQVHSRLEAATFAARHRLVEPARPSEVSRTGA